MPGCSTFHQVTIRIAPSSTRGKNQKRSWTSVAPSHFRINTGRQNISDRASHMSVTVKYIRRLCCPAPGFMVLPLPMRHPDDMRDVISSLKFSRDFPRARKEVVTAVRPLMTDAINASFSSICFKSGCLNLFRKFNKRKILFIPFGFSARYRGNPPKKFGSTPI